MAKLSISQSVSDDKSKNSNFPSSLWIAWWNAIILLKPAFAQTRVFFWFVLAVAGLTIRQDHFGVTSIVRALKLQACSYKSLLRNFHSKAICLDTLAGIWFKIVLRIFPNPVRVNGRRVLVGDGTKIAKCGKKMPGVKLLHQQSQNKAPFIMGHSLQAVAMLVHAAESVFAVPLLARIHEGVVSSNRSTKTLLGKMLDLLKLLDDDELYYFVADAYYAAHPIAKGLLQQGNHLITRVKSNAVGFTPYNQEASAHKKKGRPRFYGEKIALADILKKTELLKQVEITLYGEKTSIQYAVHDLLWKPLGRLVRFVIVKNPSRGICFLMSTDVNLDPLEIIRTYALRFKIEYTFKQAVHQIGTFTYRFWMKAMTPQRFGSGDQYLHRKPKEYRDEIFEKLHAYHVYIQAGLIAQGLMQYLAVVYPKMVWSSFGSWLRTIRPGISPSEFVVAEAFRQSFPHFLLSNGNDHALAKFILQHQNPETMPLFAMVS